MFHVGQRVVCVRNPKHNYEHDYKELSVLIKGNVYTIKEVIPEVDFYNGIQTGVRIHEIRREFTSTGDIYNDYPYGAICFRPLEDVTPGIEIFREIARNPKKKISERNPLDSRKVSHGIR